MVLNQDIVPLQPRFAISSKWITLNLFTFQGCWENEGEETWLVSFVREKQAEFSVNSFEKILI